jgi:rare lipoprotein A (peptidoglycan hydrolase)
MFKSIFEYQHSYQQTIWLALITAFLAVFMLPTSALALEAGLALQPPRALPAPVQKEGRDPYLAQAINNLPNYDYTSAGSIVATHSPKTEIANWPVKRQWTPIQQTFAATSKPAPVAAPVPPKAPATPAPAPIAPAAPSGSAVVVMEGEASYYSRAGCLGCDPQMIMANGQPLNDNALTMAIGADKKHLVGRTARVTSLATGKSVDVRITDTGGFYKAKYGNRVADLTVATKQAIGMAGGVGQVRVEVF